MCAMVYNNILFIGDLFIALLITCNLYTLADDATAAVIHIYS